MTPARMTVVLFLVVLTQSAAQAVVIETVLVGNPGNAGDTEVMIQDGTTGYGAVAYEYRIGKYEVTNAQYTAFLNAVDPTGANTLHLYLNHMSLSEHGGIDFNSGADNGSKYAVKPGRDNNPVIYVSWYDAIRFANWLHNGQGNGDTETGAYTLGPLSDRGAEPLTGKDITRNPGAQWFLPSEDEWYKAAYHKNDGVFDTYWNYPTDSDIPPSADLPPGGANSANFNDIVGTVYAVGGYPLTAGPYGTFDQAGNVDEWNEALLSQGTHFTQITRGIRGGSWFGGGTDTTQFLAASSRLQITCDGGGNAGCGSIARGFRVASALIVPEPDALMLAMFAVTALLTRSGHRLFPPRSSA